MTENIRFTRSLSTGQDAASTTLDLSRAKGVLDANGPGREFR